MGQSLNANHNQIFLFPPSLEDWIPSNHPARFIREFVSELNLKELGFIQRPTGEKGTNHYGTELLLSIWLYGYFERIRSSRKLEKALKSHLPLIWLAGLHQPDHSSLWRFWSVNKSALGKIFKETVLVADKMDMIDFALMAVDGTKLKASGSRRSMWSEKSLMEKEKELDAAISELEDWIGSDTSASADPSIPSTLLEKRKLKEEIRAKRAYLKEQGRKHLHPTEQDARVMKDQRTNDLCYNVQAVADSRSQIVTAAEVSIHENDANLLVPMIDQVAENLGRVAKETLADSGYTSEEQLALAEKRNYPVLLSPRKSLTKRKDPFNSILFQYTPETQNVTCPVNGTLLVFEREKRQKQTGIRIKVFRCRNKKCPLRALCSKEKRGKSVEVTPNRLARQNQMKKQKLPGSKNKIRNRAGIIEPVFAYTKVQGDFKRFTQKGLDGVRIQWRIEMASHNLRKIYIQWRRQE